MATRPRPSTRSSNSNTTKARTGSPTGATPRAHREETPEARRQRGGLPKTHPTRNPVATRKDKTTRRP